MPRAASVFISSTTEDLAAYRAKARDAALAAGVLPVMMEYFTASGARPPLAECMLRVDGCDVLVVIVAHRYGWKPDGRDGKSITWLECEQAVLREQEVLAFLVDEKSEWPGELKESHRIAAAVEQGSATPRLLAEVQQDIAKLAEFKKWLNSRGIRAAFSSAEDLHRKIESALREWRARHDGASGFSAVPAPRYTDPAVYLEQLRDQSSWIDIRGLQVGTGKAHRFPIEELFIPLAMLAAPKRRSGGKRKTPELKPTPLEEALVHSHLVIVGDPGSGKTTFLRHVALELVNKFAAGTAGAAFPVTIRISELADFVRRHPAGPRQPDSPLWLIDFLASRSEELNQGLDERFFRERLEKGPAILLLDGLDEAPGARERESTVRLFENATRAWRQCRFVVTTRPLSYQGQAVLSGFETARIEPLEQPAIETFLERWCTALFPESAARAKRHLAELTEALRSVPEIRRMARNPVMLTALAVVHWNERRLPEQRADLYESILNWLARSRERRPGRESAERCLTLVQHLALAMQRDAAGRQVQVEKGWAADVLAPRFDGPAEADRREAALRFVEQEEVDSGIIVSRGPAVRFWHLTFQEYLAARAIAGLIEADQIELLLDGERVYRPEWRETALLFAGVLGVRQGVAKVDGLVAAVLDRMDPNATLARRAKCAGLLGAMVSDLRPLGYQPADPRYRELMDGVLGIFDREKSKAIDFTVRLEAAEALGQAGDPRIFRDNWVRIEGGTVRLSGDRELSVKAFDIGRYPVTVAEYRRFIEDDGYQQERWWKAGGFAKRSEPLEWDGQMQHPNRPVVGVSWFDTMAYCKWAGVRLPTDAEWERARRGAEGRKYPWGNEDPDPTRANYDAGPGHPTPIGLYPAGATPEGITDMAGNVWEWPDYWNDKDETQNFRGGSWLNFESLLDSTAASGLYRAAVALSDVGFRVARDVV